MKNLENLKKREQKLVLTKIIKNTLKVRTKILGLKSKHGQIGNMKYLPSFSKEWNNIVYSFNKNNLKNLLVNDININKIIQSYFSLFFKKSRFVGYSKNSRLIERRSFLRRIFVSDAEIKHTNDKVKITLYAINREKNILKQKYTKLHKKMNLELFKRYIYLYKKFILNLYSHFKDSYKIRNEYAITYGNMPYVKHKLNYWGTFIILNNLLLKKIWSYIIKNQSKSFIKLLRKYNLLYSLNQFKFNKLILLPRLSYLLKKIIGKKIDYNIINLKSIAYNTDLFTRILALKVKKVKGSYVKKILSVLNKAYIPKVNTIKERTKVHLWDNLDIFLNKYKNLNIISNIKNNYNITRLLKNNFEQEKDKSASNDENIYNIIYNSIKYKNMRGMQIEVKGRLTKRYRADRSIYSLKWKGGLKNIDSSFKGLSSVLFRGNSNSNVTYSMAKSKRRIGAFAVKGWISGK